MSEINERWARDQRQAKKLAGYLAGLAIPLWTISYQMTGPIYTMPQWPWFSAVSVATLIAAIGCTAASAVCLGSVLIDEKPLSGSNY